MRKRLLQIVLLLLIPFTYSVADTTEKIELNGVKYTLKTSEDPYLTEPRRYAFVTGFTSKTITIPEEISYGGNNYDVVCQCISCLDGFYALESLNSEITLGNGNFRGHSAIKSVTMPFPYEPKDFFYGCNNLEEVTITNNNTSENFTIDLQSTFYSCEKLKKVTITADKSVNLIGTFFNCISLETVSMTNLKVIGITDAFRRCTNLKEITLPNTVNYIDLLTFAGCTNLKKITIPSSVTTIGERAFYGCTNLASVEMSNSVTTIEHRAFYGCIGLVSVKLSNNIKSIESETFYECTSLKEITIPNGVTYIGENAFENCTSLNSIIIPNSVTTIGSEAFRGCTSLASINSGGYKWNSVMLPTKLEAIKKSTFYGCTSLGMVNIPNSVTSIGSNAFYGCTGIESAIISNNVTTIEERAFSGCSSLKEVTIPNSVTTIGNGIFENCTSLESAKISNGLTTTGYSTFYGCTSLTSVEIPNSVNTIGSYSFYNCKSLPSIEIPNSVTTIEICAFKDCTSLKEVTIPNSVTTIGGSIFSGCTSLESAKLSNGLTTTGYNTFYGCTSLISVDIPNSVTTIGECSFDGCLSLVSIEIPNSVTTIGKLAFANCKNLKKMNPQEIEERFNLDFINPPTSLKEIGGGAFYGCNSIQYLSLPNSLTSIGEHAFMKCKNLLAVVSKIKVPFAIPDNVFLYEDYSTTTAYLWVPIGTVSDYKNCDGWKEFGLSIGPYGDADLPLPGKPGSPDDVTITANSYTIAYGDDLPEFEYTTTWAALSGTPEITCNATKTSPVGTYPIVVSKGSITYTQTTFVNGTLTITKAPLTIKAGNYTKIEGEENPTFTLTYEGFKNNETSAVLTKQPTVSCSATKDSPAGSYPVTVSGAEAQNYSINYVAGTLTVTAKGGGSGGDNPDAIITIADSKAMAVCVEKWDTDGDGKLSKAEAAAVTDIGNTFKGNTELTSLDMLQFFTGLTTIPQSAFSGCTSLKSIRLPKTIKSIENYAFCYCYELTSLTIPASVTSIGAYEFEYCHNLSEIIVEEGNTVYDSRDHCNAIIQTKYNNLKFGCKNTVIPESVTQTGGSDVFYGNEGLTSIHIPANINYINSGLFSGCKNLSSITVAADNGRYDSRNNCNAIIETDTNDLIEGCKSTVIPNDVVSIHYYAFSERAAGKVTIPGNVKTIGDQAFNSCQELKTVVMEEGVEEIGDNTFQSCRTLETIVLPSTITTIKSRAFANDNNVKFIISNISAPSEIPSDAFSACYNNATLYVPAGTKSLYMQATGWQGFENIVEKGTIERGNANGDNAVNQTDIELVKDYIMEGKTKGLDFFNADANGDYEINAADIVEIVKIKSSY